MRTIISSISILSIFWIMSCNKKKSDPEPATVPPTTTTGTNPNSGRSFGWNVSNTNSIADSIDCFTDRFMGYTLIQAASYSSNNHKSIIFYIRDTMSTRQYALGVGNTHKLTYVVANVQDSTTSGSLTITSCDLTKMSGSFNATLTSGAVINGAFTDIKRD